LRRAATVAWWGRDMTCRHDWMTLDADSRICTLCGGVELDMDPKPPVRISNDQAAALGFARCSSGLLLAKFWSFPDDVFRRFA
jgi:hypothetical protein